MDLCTDCPKRATCTSLCEKAKEIVDQDYVSQKELLFGDIGQEVKGTEWPNTTKSNKKLITEMYFLDKRTQEEIAYQLGVSQQYVSKIVKEMKAKMDI